MNEEPNSYLHWTEAEIEFVRSNYESMDDIELSVHLGRSDIAVRSKRRLLRLFRKYTPSLKLCDTPEKLRPEATGAELAVELGVHKDTVYRAAKRLGIKLRNGWKTWTPEQSSEAIELLDKMSGTKVGKILGKSKSAVIAKRWRERRKAVENQVASQSDGA